MDPTTNPCEDFYKFACGSYIKNTIIPNEKYLVTPLSKIDDLVKEQLQRALSDEPEPDEPKAFKLAKLMYQMCMAKNVDAEEGNLRPFYITLKRLGGWPVLEGPYWDGRAWNWVKLTKLFKQMGFPTGQIVAINVRTDYMNSSRKYIDVRFIFCIYQHS